jgi:hypothetical protein
MTTKNEKSADFHESLTLRRNRKRRTTEVNRFNRNRFDINRFSHSRKVLQNQDK